MSIQNFYSLAYKTCPSEFVPVNVYVEIFTNMCVSHLCLIITSPKTKLFKLNTNLANTNFPVYNELLTTAVAHSVSRNKLHLVTLTTTVELDDPCD